MCASSSSADAGARIGPRSSILFGAAAVALAGCIDSALAAPLHYDARRLWLTPGLQQERAADLDNSGIAVGWVFEYPDYAGVYWRTTGAKPRGHQLRTPRGNFFPVRVNDEGYVAGAVLDDATGTVDAAVLGPDGRLHGMNGILPPSYSSRTIGVNNDGLVAGLFEPKDGNGAIRGFAWDRTNGFVDLGMLHEGDDELQPDAVNDAGVIVGTAGGSDHRAFAWTADAGLVDLSTSLPSSDYTEAEAINTRGQVAIADGTHRVGYVLDLQTRTYSTLPTRYPHGLNHITGINANGDLVGVENCRRNIGATCPMVWRHEGAGWQVYDLRTITSWRGHRLDTLFQAAAINDAGQILANDAQNVYLLTPR